MVLDMGREQEEDGRSWESCQTWILPGMGLSHSCAELTGGLGAACGQHGLWANLAIDSRAQHLWDLRGPFSLPARSVREGKCQPIHSHYKGSETKRVKYIPFQEFRFPRRKPTTDLRSEAESQYGRTHRKVPAAEDFGAAIINFKIFLVQHFLWLHELFSIIVIHPFLLKNFGIIFYCLYLSKNHSWGGGKGLVFENKDAFREI